MPYANSVGFITASAHRRIVYLASRRQNLPWSVRSLLSSLKLELARGWEWKMNKKRIKSFSEANLGQNVLPVQTEQLSKGWAVTWEAKVPKNVTCTRTT